MMTIIQNCFQKTADISITDTHKCDVAMEQLNQSFENGKIYLISNIVFKDPSLSILSSVCYALFNTFSGTDNLSCNDDQNCICILQ